MPETKKKSPAVVKPLPQKQDVTSDEINEIIFPDLSREEFSIGSRKFRIRPLSLKFEQMFRRSTMPIIEAEIKPIEKAIFIFTTDQALITNDLKITESIMQSEINADVYITNAVVVLCMSQDARILKAIADGVELPLEEQLKIEKEYRLMIDNCDEWPSGSGRHYLREVIRKQSDKLKMVQLVGESLMARFAEVSSLVGERKRFDSLKLDFTQRAQNFLEKVGSRVGASANLFSPSTGTGSETNQIAEQQKPPNSPPEKEESPIDEGQAGPEEEKAEAATNVQ
jgi:hypothetical protein